MRYDSGVGQPAADLLATAPIEEIERILREFGEEPHARRIARDIVAIRAAHPVRTTGALASLVARAVQGRHGRLHPATRTFQALRIAVNDELGALTEALPQALSLLRKGGRLAVISFHSLEDRIVKTFFRRMAGQAPDNAPRHLPAVAVRPEPELRILTPRPVTAAAEEIAANPRSRSARLRVAERI
jgi:16S rRNA (cytosine1402-N4)-methyltransferase